MGTLSFREGPRRPAMVAVAHATASKDRLGPERSARLALASPACCCAQAKFRCRPFTRSLASPTFADWHGAGGGLCAMAPVCKRDWQRASRRQLDSGFGIAL